MTATYTFDIFCTLDGFGSHQGDWGGYWGKQGPELIEHRFEQYGPDQRMVLGATTYRDFEEMLGASDGHQDVDDSWVTRMLGKPMTVVSSTLQDPLQWDATAVSGDGVEVVRRLKSESDVPLRSHGSLELNHSLMAAGLVDRVQVTVFPVISGKTGLRPIFGGAGDFDLELLEQRTLDGRTLELVYRPTVH